jgi:hypothetical protein
MDNAMDNLDNYPWINGLPKSTSDISERKYFSFVGDIKCFTKELMSRKFVAIEGGGGERERRRNLVLLLLGAQHRLNPRTPHDLRQPCVLKCQNLTRILPSFRRG